MDIYTLYFNGYIALVGWDSDTEEYLGVIENSSIYNTFGGTTKLQTENDFLSLCDLLYTQGYLPVKLEAYQKHDQIQ